jgi:hypothetical protein
MCSTTIIDSRIWGNDSEIYFYVCTIVIVGFILFFDRPVVFVGCFSSSSSWADPGSDLNKFPTKPSKTISPLGKPEGNIVHRVHNTVSPEVDFMGGDNTQVFSF